MVLLEGRVVSRWIGWTGLALAVISLASTGTLLTPALFPFLALGTLLFVLWIAALTVALLRNPRTVNRAEPHGDPARHSDGAYRDMIACFA